jgi:acetyl esterase/lipase
VGLGAPGTRGTLLALHGGGYVFGPDERHWTTWRTLAVRSGRRVVAPLYRLAPEGTAGETVHHAARIAEELAAEGPLAIMGDSAGGGLALAVAQQLRERGVRPPLLLSAPWLDATVSDARSTLARDPWLGADGLRAAATMYAGGLPLTHPLLSPVDADLTDLGPITVASGTRDVLHPDSLRLAERVPGTRLLVGEGLVHNYPILPIPEARAALRAFLAALR